MVRLMLIAFSKPFQNFSFGLNPSQRHATTEAAYKSQELSQAYYMISLSELFWHSLVLRL